MKILFILSALMLASAQANFFTDIGNSLKTVFSTLGNAVMHELDTTGVSLLNAGVSAGKTLLSQGVQVNGKMAYFLALALNTANALENQKAGTRDLSSLTQVESILHTLVDTVGVSLKGSLNRFSAGLKSVIEKVSNMQLSPEEVISEVDKLVATHNVFADALLKTIETKAGGIVSSLMHKSKRNGFTDFFSGIGTSLSTLFQPMIDGVKNLATSAGTAIKNGATGLLSAAKESVSQLGQKLQPHIAALGSSLTQLAVHGATALSALKDAGTDILQQTLQNAKEPLNQITNTLGSAGQTVLQHVAGTLLGANTGTDTAQTDPSA